MGLHIPGPRVSGEAVGESAMPSIIDTFGKPDRGDMRHATRAAPPAFLTRAPWHLHACGGAYEDAGADPGRPV